MPAHHNNLLNKAGLLRQLILVSLLVTAALTSARSQSTFITKGHIEYERKTNQYAFMDENDVWDEMAKQTLSKFVTYYFDLYFTPRESLFKSGREADAPQNKYWGVFDADNTIFHNTDSSKALIQKKIFGDTYLISDSIRKVDWKIGAEMRTIAGFNCRKAVGKIFDSIVVIAFYSDEIISSAGPESFAGLPGMILGLAIPKMHTTWYATKVVVSDTRPAEIVLPKKGKKIQGTEFASRINDILKNYGPEQKRFVWQLLL